MSYRVSVVVSTYSGERFIERCLRMLLEQTCVADLEIIVVDSGSPENERAIVEAMQLGHDNIRYLRTPRETLYASWNRALEVSTGEYFANFNVDDWIRKTPWS